MRVDLVVLCCVVWGVSCDALSIVAAGVGEMAWNCSHAWNDFTDATAHDPLHSNQDKGFSFRFYYV